jgi:WD40 repeat protein/tetratricopeptide (TPR) repeat protein/serine/threonine protein kinase
MSDASSAADLLNNLAQEFVERYRDGERPSLSEYAERHPELAGQIRELFPTLAVMEEFGSVGAAPTDCGANSKHIPERLGEYRILREVGRGGMGVVYEAVQESLGRHVALKVLPIRGAVPEKQRERFRREAKTAANLHHTNIVPVFGVGEAEGVHFYAMQFIHGQGLDAVLEEVRRLRARMGESSPTGTPTALTASLAAGLVSGFEMKRSATRTDPAVLTRSTHVGSTSAIVGKTGESASGADYYRSVARIGLQVADALVHAHAQGVLHRDVKPSNLLLDARGSVWVTDFGLAKMEGSDELTTPGDIVGTLRYMPPERFGGQDDLRGDVYGLGLTLYEMLALRPAFDAPDRARLLEQVRNGEVPNPRHMDPRVPRDLETVVLKAAAREPRDRYPTAVELAADLGRFLADRPVLARRVSWPEQARRWCRRNRAVAALAAGVFLSLALAVVVLAFKNLEIQEQKGETERALQKAGDSEMDAKTQEGIARAKENLARAKEKLAKEKGTLADAQKLLAGRRFHNAQIFLANLAVETGDIPRAHDLLETLRPKPDEDDLRTFEWYYLWQRCNGSLRYTCRGHEGAVQSVQVSPDGKTGATSGADGTVRLWDLSTGRQRAIFRGSPSAYSRIAFSPDGRLLACGRFGQQSVRVWNLTTGGEVNLTAQDSTPRSLAFSTDGATLACGYENGSIRFWDPVTGEELIGLAGKHVGPVVGLAFSPNGKTLASASSWRDTVTKLWDLSVSSKTPVSPIRPRLELPGTMSLAFSPDSTRLLTGLVDHQFPADGQGSALAPPDKQGLVIWDAGTGKRLAGFNSKNHRDALSMTFSSDGRSLIWGGMDRSVRMCDHLTGRLQTLGAHGGLVLSVADSPDGKVIVSGGSDGALKVWNRDQLSEPLNLSDTEGGDVRFATFTRDGKTLVAGGSKWLKSWDTASGRAGFTINMDCARGAVSPDGRMLAALAVDGTLNLYDMATGRELASAMARCDSWVDLAWSPDGKTLASCCNRDPMVRLWDVTSNLKEFTSLSAPSASCLRFSRDGQRLTIGTQFTGLYVFDVTTRERKFFLPQVDSSGAALFAMDLSSDGRTLAAVVGFGTVKIWDGDTMILRASVTAHTQETWGLAISPDGRTLATASIDGTVKLWDTFTGQERLSFRPPVSPKSTAVPFTVAFSPDGRTLAIGCGQVYLLHAATSPEARRRKIQPDPDDPDSPVMLNARAAQMWKNGNVEEAEASYRRALGLLEQAIVDSPDLDQARYELSRGACTLSALLSSDGRPAEAERYRLLAEEQLRQLPPESRLSAAERLCATGESLQRGGLEIAADSIYALVASISSDEANLSAIRGRAHFARGQYEKAVSEWSPLFRDPSAPYQLVESFVLAHYRTANYQAVIATARAANRGGTAKVPCNPFVLAMALAKRGDQSAARQWYLIGRMRLYRSESLEAEQISLRAETAQLLGLPEELTADEKRIAADWRNFLTLVIEADPEAAWVHYQRGLHFASANEWEKAVEDYSRAIAMLPERGVVRQHRARAYRQLKRWDLAIADYSEAIKLDPGNVNAWNERGLVYFNGLGNVQAAIRDYSKAIEMSPGNTALWFNRGVARNRLRRWADASADFDEAIKLNANFTRSWSERGYSNLQLGRNDGAVADYSKAIELDSKQVGCWQYRAAAYHRLGKYHTAIADLTKGLELVPNDGILLLERAGNHAPLGHRNEARADLDEALKHASPQLAATVHQTLAYFLNDGFGPEHRDPKGASEAARKALSIAPKNGLAWGSLGRAQYLAGDFKSALDSLTKATDLRSDVGPHFVFRAMAHWKLGQPDESRRWYSRWAMRMEESRASWEGNRPVAVIWDRYRSEAAALWGSAISEPAPPPRAVPSPR